MKNRDLTSDSLGVAVLILGLLQSIGTLLLFPTCGAKADGSYMKCHWTGQTLIGLGLVVTIIAVIYLLIKKSYVRGGLILSVVPIGAMTIAVPNFLIGVCGMNNMQCRSITLPTDTIIGAVAVILGILGAVYLLRKENERCFAE